MPVDVLRRFDLVGFDPRGVGLSTPVECIPDRPRTRSSPPSRGRPAEAAGRRLRARDEGRRRLRAASTATRWAPSTPSTPRGTWTGSARRSATSKLTYLGYSYGTTLGSTYAELFPDKVRALVLDGVGRPRRQPARPTPRRAPPGWRRASTRSRELHRASRPAARSARIPAAFLDDLLAQAAQTPIPSKKAGETAGRDAGRDHDGGARRALRHAARGRSWPRRWPRRKQGDAAGRVLAWPTATRAAATTARYTNLIDANIGDQLRRHQGAGLGEARSRKLAVEWNQKYPLFGAGAAAGLYTCIAVEGGADARRCPKRDDDGSAPIARRRQHRRPGDARTRAPQDMARDLQRRRAAHLAGPGAHLRTRRRRA